MDAVKRFLFVIQDGDTEPVFWIDFQETPQEYRKKRLEDFIKKYPEEEGFYIITEDA